MKTLILHENQKVHLRYNSGNHDLVFDSHEFNEFSQGQVDSYNDYIDQLNELNGKNPHWWASSISSRNIFFSRFFLDWCYLNYCLDVMSRLNIECIVCSSSVMYETLKAHPKLKNVKIVIHSCLSLKDKIKDIKILNFLYSSLGFIKYNINLKIAATNTYKTQKLSSNLYLIDTFITEGSLNKNKFQDNYFTCLLDNLPSNNLAYLPYLYNINDIKKCFRVLRDNIVPFIIKEDYLKMKDYLWTIFNSYNSFSIKIPGFTSDTDFDYRKILHSVNSKSFNRDTMNFLLLYCLPSRLKEKSVQIDTLLDWYEAQPLDHVQNLAFKVSYPDINISSYIGAFFSFYQSISYQMITSQVNHLISAQKIFLQGDGIKDQFHNLKGVQYLTAPASRINTDNSLSVKNFGTKLFIVLPNMVTQAVEIINVVSQSNLSENEIFVSLHPRTNIDYLKSVITNKLSNKYKVHYIQNISSSIHEAKVIISTGTSAFTDAFHHRIPCIVIGSQFGHTLNFIPNEFLDKLFHITYCPSRLEKDINDIMITAKNNSDHFDLFFKNYIQSATSENIEKFQYNTMN